MNVILNNRHETMGGFCCGPLIAAAPLVAGAAGASSTVTTVLSLAGAGLGLVGGLQEAKGIEAQGEAQRQNADFQAKQLIQKAGQEEASSQRELINVRDRERLLKSQAIATSAAGGGDVLDVLPVLSGIESEGDYRALSALYEGKDAAQSYENQARGAVWEGDVAYKSAKAKASAVRTKAYATAIGSAASGLSKYAPTSGTGGRTIGVPDQKWDTGDYLSAGARRDYSYSQSGGYGPYRY